MISDEELKNLAKLSRIEVPEEEFEGLKKDIGSILGYVEQITQIDEDGTHQPEADQHTTGINTEKKIGEHRNIMREDGGAHESGVYTDDLLSEAPDVKDGYIKVKKIL